MTAGRSRLKFSGNASRLAGLSWYHLKAIHTMQGIVEPISYGKSFVLGAARFEIESRAMIDGVEYYQCAACLGEHSYARYDFFKNPSYSMTPVFSTGEWDWNIKQASFGRYFVNRSPKGFLWGPDREIQLCYNQYREIKSTDEIIDATIKGVQVVAQTNINGTILEYPLKTINIFRNNGIEKFQVDTGLIVYPENDTVHLGFIAFNRLDSVDLLIYKPKSIAFMGRHYHYKTNIYKSIMAVTRLFMEV